MSRLEELTATIQERPLTEDEIRELRIHYPHALEHVPSNNGCGNFWAETYIRGVYFNGFDKRSITLDQYHDLEALRLIRYRLFEPMRKAILAQKLYACEIVEHSEYESGGWWRKEGKVICTPACESWKKPVVGLSRISTSSKRDGVLCFIALNEAGEEDNSLRTSSWYQLDLTKIIHAFPDELDWSGSHTGDYTSAGMEGVYLLRMPSIASPGPAGRLLRAMLAAY